MENTIQYDNFRNQSYMEQVNYPSIEKTAFHSWPSMESAMHMQAERERMKFTCKPVVIWRKKINPVNIRHMMILHIFSIALILGLCWFCHTYAVQIGSVIHFIMYAGVKAIVAIICLPGVFAQYIRARKIKKMIKAQEKFVVEGFGEEEIWLS